jgi:hypothetical protein
MEAKKGGGGVTQYAFAASALEGRSSQQPATATLPPVQTRYPMYWVGLRADLDKHANSRHHRAFIIYRPVILEPPVNIKTAVHPTFPVLQIFIDVESDKECY